MPHPTKRTDSRMESIELADGFMLYEVKEVSVVAIDVPVLTNPFVLQPFLAALRTAVEKARRAVIVIDLESVELISSQVLGELVSIAKMLRQRGVQLRLASPNPRLREILQIVRFDRVMDVHESLSDALQERADGRTVEA